MRILHLTLLFCILFISTDVSSLQLRPLLSQCRAKFCEGTFLQPKNSRSITTSISKETSVFRNSLAALLVASLCILNPSTSYSVSIPSTSLLWESAKFFDQQDEGRVAQVTYSPDGKIAVGVDIDGNKFTARLQPDTEGPPLILAPLGLLTLGAIAFLSSSEGRVFRTALGDKSASTSTKEVRK
jgi:hypothetical protein